MQAELRRDQPHHPRAGKEKVVAARFTRNHLLRARGIEHNDALRRLANRLVGILQGCLKTRTLYDEATA